MQKRRFVLCDPDYVYVERFMEYVQRRAHFLFTVYGFTEVEQLEAFLENEDVEMGLLDESLWNSLESEKRQVLAEKMGYAAVLSAERSGEMPGRIFRFQPMGQILRELVRGYEKQCPEPEPEGSCTQVTAFWSPVGQCGKTTCALQLGQVLARKQGMKVLYLNLEAFPGEIAGIRGQAGNSLSDHLYYRQMEESGQRIMSLTDTVGSISVIAPAVNPEDLWGTSSQELSEMIEDIRASGIYDLLILDLGSGGNPVPILRVCSRVFLLSSGNPAAESKLHQATEYLTQDSVGIAAEILRRLVPPAIPEMRRQLSGEGCRKLEDWLEKEWVTWDSNRNESIS